MFYRWGKRLRAYGVDGLHPRRTFARPGCPSTLGPVEERAIRRDSAGVADVGAEAGVA